MEVDEIRKYRPRLDYLGEAVFYEAAGKGNLRYGCLDYEMVIKAGQVASWN